jgi:glycosyltransferase involved in cell wall biosynthesis
MRLESEYKMQKELCIDARMATSSGIGTYIRSLLPRIKDQYRLRLIVDPDSLTHCPELTNFDVVISKARVYSIQEQISLPLLIPRCDLFWSPHFNVPLAPIRARRRLVTIHDVFFLACPQDLGIAKRAYARLFFNAAVKRSHHVITDSQFSLGEICKFIGPYQEKITAISLGVDSSCYDQVRIDRESTILKRYILYVGNLAPHKNICHLIRSLDLVPPDVHLVLVGKESEWDAWKSEVKQRPGRVTVCGKVSQETLVSLYQHAELLIHPSHYEGFGLTPLEAMSAGCPVVVSRAASLPEVCGDAAVYVDPYSVESIAKGILSVWGNEALKLELRSRGKKRVSLFDWDEAAQRHIEVIDRVLKMS